MEEAKGDLEHARKSIALGDFNWVCFAAQQAAEKAVKALHLHQGTVAWGHSVFDLLEAFPTGTEVSPELTDAALNLDRCYIAPRYPDAHPAGPARRYYTEGNARQAVANAEKVVSWCDQGLSSRP
jgi:HEPN domain-containing protein